MCPPTGYPLRYPSHPPLSYLCRTMFSSIISAVSAPFGLKPCGNYLSHRRRNNAQDGPTRSPELGKSLRYHSRPILPALHSHSRSHRGFHTHRTIDSDETEAGKDAHINRCTGTSEERRNLNEDSPEEMVGTEHPRASHF